MHKFDFSQSFLLKNLCIYDLNVHKFVEHEIHELQTFVQLQYWT